MSEELLKQFNMTKGQKVLYPHQIGSNYGAPIYMSIETVKDVSLNYKDEVILITEETEGYININDVYTKDLILKLFDE